MRPVPLDAYPRSGLVSGLVAGVPLFGLVLIALIAPEATTGALKAGFDGVVHSMGLVWQGFFVVFAALALGIALSPWGATRIGGASEPDSPWISWLAVVLCTLLAGGGVFFSAAEPLYHLTTVPPAFDAEPSTRDAGVAALAASHLHWGVLAWAMVATLGTIHVSARQTLDGRPLRPRELLSPLPDAWLDGTFGDVVDGLCLLAAAAGTIAPIGFLALQLADAAHTLGGFSAGLATQAVVLAALVGLYTLSAWTGVDRGIVWLSRLNVVLAAIVALALLVLGPAGALMTLFGDSLLAYARTFVPMALGRSDPDWAGAWTVFYWGWFLGYAPLMSLFLARISKGRTIRTLVLTVAIAAPIVTHAWFALVGGTGILTELASPGQIAGPLAERGAGAAWLGIVGTLPAPGLWMGLAIVLVFCFLATTADSVSFAIAVVLSRNDEPPGVLRVGVAVSMGATALVLLWLGQGGIDLLQHAVVLTAVPVTAVMAVAAFGGVSSARRYAREDPSRIRAAASRVNSNS